VQQLAPHELARHRRSHWRPELSQSVSLSRLSPGSLSQLTAPIDHTAGKGEPRDALRPLLRSWCLVEMCSAPDAVHDTDPYATPSVNPSVAPLRLAIGGYDDDVEPLP